MRWPRMDGTHRHDVRTFVLPSHTNFAFSLACVSPFTCTALNAYVSYTQLIHYLCLPLLFDYTVQSMPLRSHGSRLICAPRPRILMSDNLVCVKVPKCNTIHLSLIGEVTSLRVSLSANHDLPRLECAYILVPSPGSGSV